MFIYSFSKQKPISTMERIILLSFNSTDNDDCGLPYLCSKSGCNETQLIGKVLTPAQVALKPFWTSRAPCVMAESLGSQVKSNKIKRKKKRKKKEEEINTRGDNGFDSISKSENRNSAKASVSTVLSPHSKLLPLNIATIKAPTQISREESAPCCPPVAIQRRSQHHSGRAVLSHSCKC